MEAELLRGMIDDRERRIARIQRKSEEQQAKAERLSKELEEVSGQNQETLIHFQSEKTRLLHARQTALQHLESIQRDFQQQGMSLQAYAGVVKQEQQLSGDASFVMKMQAQLCKAMHSLGIVDHQMDLAKRHAENMGKFLKESLARMTNEMTEIELQLMNELVILDTGRREVENELTSKLGEIQKEIDAVQEQLGNSSDEEDAEEDADEDDVIEKKDDGSEKDEDENAEEDEEEKEAKELLMKMLQEKREEIRKLENTIKEQEETIQELQEHLEEIRGELDGEDSNKIQASNSRESVTKEVKRDDLTKDTSNGGVDALDLLAAVRNRNMKLEESASEEDSDEGESDEDDEEEEENGEEGETESEPHSESTPAAVEEESESATNGDSEGENNDIDHAEGVIENGHTNVVNSGKDTLSESFTDGDKQIDSLEAET